MSESIKEESFKDFRKDIEDQMSSWDWIFEKFNSYMNWLRDKAVWVNKPIFKVGEYVVYESTETVWLIKYIKLTTITKKWKVFLYNWSHGSNLRTPTEEELNIYFK
jgi:hypothetical protein